MATKAGVTALVRVAVEHDEEGATVHRIGQPSDGCIEAHHLIPRSQKQEPGATSLDGLMLVCSNCHRIVHRSKDVDKNL